jgi:hypothetical protein
LAGQLVVIGGRRVGVENLSAQVAFDIKAPDGPLEAVRPGALYAPPEDRFEIRVAGSLATYTVLVHIPARQTMLRPRRPAAATIGPSTRFEVELTGRQWQILAAYGDPLRAGRTVPATHAEVADRVGWSMATVRVECSEIWSSFALAGIPMRDFPDKRDAIVDATLRHCVSRADKNGSP